MCDSPAIAHTICLMLFGLMLSGQDRGWTRQTTGDVDAYTRLGTSARAELVSALGETRETLDRDLWPLPSPTLPVRVLIEPSTADFARYRRFDNSSGFCHAGEDRDYIVVRQNATELLRAARHEMVHRHLIRSVLTLPDWLEEGLAEYYSSLRRTGTDVLVGVDIPHHRQVLAQASLLSESEFLRPNPAQSPGAAANTAAVYYAQSWALVHYLQSTESRRARFKSFLQALTRGDLPSLAYRTTFNETLTQTFAVLRDHLASTVLPTRKVSGVAAPAPTAASPAALDEINALRADIFLALGQREDADPIWRSLEDQGSTRDARSAALAGMLALRRLDFAAARTTFERAIALETRDPQVWFEYAMLLRDANEDPAEVERCLNKTLEFTPAFAPAWAQLAKSKDRRNATREALADLQRAVSIDPRRYEYLEALAELTGRLGDRPQAIALARRAFQAAKTTPQRTQAESLLSVWEQEDERTKAVIAPGKPEVRTPDSWKPAPGETATGTLTTIDCPDTGLVFHLKTPTGELLLEARDPSQITMTGAAAGRTFSCGPQSPAPTVTATYQPTAPSSGRLIRLEMPRPTDTPK